MESLPFTEIIQNLIRIHQIQPSPQSSIVSTSEMMYKKFSCPFAFSHQPCNTHPTLLLAEESNANDIINYVMLDFFHLAACRDGVVGLCYHLASLEEAIQLLRSLALLPTSPFLSPYSPCLPSVTTLQKQGLHHSSVCQKGHDFDQLRIINSQ